MERELTKTGLRIWTWLVVLFLHAPIAIIILYAFNAQTAQGWPITDWTTKWFSPTIHDGEMQQALLLSLKAAAGATIVAILLGSAAAFAVHRFRFFGRESISFLFILPLALPGIITGMALNSFFTLLEVQFRPLDHHRGPCHLLHGDHLQQRDRAAPAHTDLAVRGFDGSRRRRLSDLPVRHLSNPLDSARLGGTPRLRALVRRGDRHDVHGRSQNHSPDLDLRQHPHRPAAARSERHRLPDLAGHDHPGDNRAAPDTRIGHPSNE